MFNLSKTETLTQLFIDFKGGVEITVSFPMGNLCNSSTTEHNYTGCSVHMVDLPCDLAFLLGFFCCSQEGYRLQSHFPYGFYETYICIFFAGLDIGETSWTKAGLCGGILYPQRYASP